jgi:hypothetical protein
MRSGILADAEPIELSALPDFLSSVARSMRSGQYVGGILVHINICENVLVSSPQLTIPYE